MSAHACADDPKLIGYFYCDCPQWVHTSPATKWRGSLSIQTCSNHEAWTPRALGHCRTLLPSYPRQYPPLRPEPPYSGRFDGRQTQSRLPEEVVRAALPYVDVLSLSMFWDRGEYLKVRRCGTGADFSRRNRVALWPTYRRGIYAPTATPVGRRRRTACTIQTTIAMLMEALWDIAQCVGYHLCGPILRTTHAGFLRTARPGKQSD